MKDPYAPTAFGAESARFKVDTLICQRCWGFLGTDPGDKDRSCICFNHAHTMMVRTAARERQRSLLGRR